MVYAERGIKAAQTGHLVTSFRNGPRGKPSRGLRQMIMWLEAPNHLPLAKSKCKVSIILTVSYCWITSNNIAVTQNASVFSHFASIVRLYNK